MAVGQRVPPFKSWSCLQTLQLLGRVQPYQKNSAWIVKVRVDTSHSVASNRSPSFFKHLKLLIYQVTSQSFSGALASVVARLTCSRITGQSLGHTGPPCPCRCHKTAIEWTHLPCFPACPNRSANASSAMGLGTV